MTKFTAVVFLILSLLALATDHVLAVERKAERVRGMGASSTSQLAGGAAGRRLKGSKSADDDDSASKGGKSADDDDAPSKGKKGSMSRK